MKKLLLLLLLSTNCYASYQMKCEEMTDSLISIIERCYVPDGWLVIFSSVNKGGITFYPDKEHKWKLDK